MSLASLTADGVAAFAVFARHRNFTRAAEELHIAQPSLHAKITKLSRTLGVTLYERSGRELILTGDGEALATFAADQQRAADDLLSRFGRPSPRIRVAAGRAALRWVLDSALRRLISAGLELSVSPANRAEAIEQVERGAVDVAAIAYDPPPRHLASRHLRSVPQVLLVPADHRLGAASALQLAQLDGVPLVVPPPGRPHRQALERAMAGAGCELTVASEADGWDLIVHLTELGLGATIVNGCVPPPPSLLAVPVVDLPEVGYWLAWRQARRAAVEPLLAEIDHETATAASSTSSTSAACGDRAGGGDHDGDSGD